MIQNKEGKTYAPGCAWRSLGFVVSVDIESRAPACAVGGSVAGRRPLIDEVVLRSQRRCTADQHGSEGAQKEGTLAEERQHLRRQRPLGLLRKEEKEGREKETEKGEDSGLS